MFINAQHNGPSRFYELIDLDTGKEIKGVVWADDVAGTYGQVKVVDGRIEPEVDEIGNHLKIYDKTGNILLVEQEHWKHVHVMNWAEGGAAWAHWYREHRDRVEKKRVSGPGIWLERWHKRENICYNISGGCDAG